MKKNFEEIELLKKLSVVPQWTTGMKKTNGSMWIKKFTDAGYVATGWRFCDGYGDWWDEYHNGEEFIYAEQCVGYVEKF